MQRKSVYIERNELLCISYAKKPVFSVPLCEKLTERIEKYSQPRQNLSLSFRNLSVSVATDSRKEKRLTLPPPKKLFFFALNGALQNVKIILHTHVRHRLSTERQYPLLHRTNTGDQDE